jgi:hypothetical protein
MRTARWTRIGRAAANPLAWRIGVSALLMGAFLSTAAPASAQEGESYKVADGLGVYLGVLPAAIVRGQPEERMHGGVPSGAHEYHIIIAVFDAATGARVEDAKVNATVSGLGHVGGRLVHLKPMTIAGTVTYGQFVALPGEDIYDIAVDIFVPGRESPVRADFAYQHAR